MRLAVEPLVPPPPALQRTRGLGRVAFARVGGRTRLTRLRQEGAAKIRLPRGPGDPEAVLINTGGGLTGGDDLRWEAEAGTGARAALTTQACERIYRAAAGAPPARVRTRLTVGGGGCLAWLPQETILFDGCRLDRRLEADVAEDAVLLALETLVFGRAAMGERVNGGCLHDRWRVRRGGRLLFADDVRIEDVNPGVLGRPAVLAGNVAVATLLYVAPDAEDRLDRARAALGGGGGVSAFDGKLVARVTAGEGLALRRVLARLVTVLRDGAGLPRAWML